MVPPSRSGQHPILGERYGPERCGALPGWRGGTNEGSLLRHRPSSFLGGARKRAPTLILFRTCHGPRLRTSSLILGVDGGVELPYEQRAAVLRSQRPPAQLCRSSDFSTDCRGMIFAISCTTCFGGTHERSAHRFASERARCGAGPSRNSGTAQGNSADCRWPTLLRRRHAPITLASSRTVAKHSDNGMADLETYYPFVRHMRVSESR